MSSSSRSDVCQICPETIAIATGVTAAILPMPYQLGVILKYVSGGSLLFIGSTAAMTVGTVVYGSTYAINKTYVVGTSEVLNISATDTFYLQGSGSTTVCSILRLLAVSDNHGL